MNIVNEVTIRCRTKTNFGIIEVENISHKEGMPTMHSYLMID